MKAKKVLGWKVPCVPGKKHVTEMVTDVCKYCKKQIEEPKPWVRSMERQVAKLVFGN